MGEDRVAVLLFYHTLCLIHVLKHFTNCALHEHELFHFHATQLWVTLLHTRVVGPLKQQRLTLYMYMGELLLVGSLTVHLITIKHSYSKGWMRMTDLYLCSPFFQHQITNVQCNRHRCMHK